MGAFAHALPAIGHVAALRRPALRLLAAAVIAASPLWPSEPARGNQLDRAATHDFNGDAISDIAWRHSGGTAAAWLMTFETSRSVIFGVVPTEWQIVGQRDFNGDGYDDWLWRDINTGTLAI